MRYFLIAGEASGDLHAAALIQALKQQDPHAEFMGLGGDRMAAAGAHLYQHYRRMAFMGFVAVLKNLDKVRENFAITRQALLKEQPDVLILIDYPSFNLKIAAFCREQLPKTKIVYYIPPKVWAWKSWRVHRIAALCDEVLGIFPFEPDFYAKYGYRCTYVGNPTADAIRTYRQSSNRQSPTPQSSNRESSNRKSIALFPGSRMSEITHCLPTMLEAARRIEGYSITVCQAPGIDPNIYNRYVRAGEELTSDAYALMNSATVALVNSGTATLETALMNCPQAAVYYVACPHLLGLIWKTVFTIRHFTLVNIIAARSGYFNGRKVKEGTGVIYELIAYRFTPDQVEAELRRILTDEAYKKNMLAGYEHIHRVLGDTPAAVNAARIISSLLNKH